MRLGFPEIDFPKVRAALSFEGQPVGEIGLRYKGNSSYMGARDSLKKSFKLDINDLDKHSTPKNSSRLSLRASPNGTPIKTRRSIKTNSAAAWVR